MSDLLERVSDQLRSIWDSAVALIATPLFYTQIAVAAAALVLAALLAMLLKRRVAILRDEPKPGPALPFRHFLFKCRSLLFPLLGIALLGVAVEAANATFEQSWLIRIAQGVMVVMFVYALITGFVHNRVAKKLLIWVGIPLGTLQVFGWLEPVTGLLDQVSLTVGNIRLSLLALLRTLIFGALLFWLGSISNNAGKQVIRTQQRLTAGTRELFAKLFEISLFFIIFLLLLQVMGINLTTLAVFGGALGIGLGFGLQQIASNFISGMIILLDRSITIGDYVELEDGRSGMLRELNMRYGILETYDGKDIMVPNEQFITSSYTNWTHKDKRQRYPLEFQVAYSTDLDLLFEKVREVCSAHPNVISGEHIPIEFRPDAEIAGFGESGIDILVEFWMEGIDDGENRVGADLLHAIWRVIQEHGMQIPFPQREVRILGERDRP